MTAAGQWWLVDDYGDGDPAVGPFDSYTDAAAYDPTDDRLEPQQVFELDRPQYDAVAALIRAMTVDIAASNDQHAVERMAGHRHGVLLALAEIARTRYVVERAPFGPQWWDVADTWTGWHERHPYGQTRDADLVAAEAHARQLNDAAAAAALTGTTT